MEPRTRQSLNFMLFCFGTPQMQINVDNVFEDIFICENGYSLCYHFLYKNGNITIHDLKLMNILGCLSLRILYHE